MPNPACQVKDGSGSYQATTDGVNVTPGNTVTINLIDTSADIWSIACVYTDDTSDADTVTASLTINPSLRTATFTAPAAGKAYIFRSKVNNGVGADGKVKSSYTTTFGIYTLTSDSLRVLAANETTEGGAFGWVSTLNAKVRAPGGGTGTPGGSSGQFQYNNSGALGGVPGVTIPVLGSGLQLANGYFLWSPDSTNSLYASLIGLDTDDVIRIGSSLAFGYPGFDIAIDVGFSKKITLQGQALLFNANNYAFGHTDEAFGGGVGVMTLKTGTMPAAGAASRIILCNDGGTLKYVKPDGTVIVLRGAAVHTCTLEQFGAVGDGVTDDSAAFNAARAALAAGTYGALILGAATYLVDAPDDPATNPWPFGIAVIGQGPGKSVLKITTNNELLIFASTDATNRQKSTLLRDFKVLGNVAGINQWGIGNGFSGGDGSGSGFVVENVHVESCALGFLTAYGPTNGDGAKFTNCKAKSCTYGYEAIWQANFVGCQATACGTGVLWATGNVTWTGGDIAGCTTNAVYISAGGNDGHGIFSGAQINHNTGPIHIEAVANGFTFDGCHIYDTGLEVAANTGFVQLTGCILAPTTYSLNADSCVRFVACRVVNDYFVAYSDGGSQDVEWRDCVNHLGGALPSWVPFKLRHEPLATTDATPQYIVLDTLAVGEAKSVDVIATVQKSDGTVRQSFKLSALIYGAAGPTATLDGGALTDAAPRGTGTAVVELDLNGADVRLKVTGIAATNLTTRYDVSLV